MFADEYVWSASVCTNAPMKRTFDVVYQTKRSLLWRRRARVGAVKTAYPQAGRAPNVRLL